MEKFPSQQAALRAALTLVLGTEPKKGSLEITDEQRKAVGVQMMQWLQEERWSIRPGTRAAANPLNYIVGKQPTCLIEAWVTPKQQQPKATPTNGAPAQSESKFDLIKKALDAGIITKEEAQAKFMALLDAK